METKARVGSPYMGKTFPIFGTWLIFQTGRCQCASDSHFTVIMMTNCSILNLDLGREVESGATAASLSHASLIIYLFQTEMTSWRERPKKWHYNIATFYTKTTHHMRCPIDQGSRSTWIVTACGVLVKSALYNGHSLMRMNKTIWVTYAFFKSTIITHMTTFPLTV